MTFSRLDHMVVLHMVVLFLIFSGNSILFSIVAVTFHILSLEVAQLCTTMMYESICFPQPCQQSALSNLGIFANLTGEKWV